MSTNFYVYDPNCPDSFLPQFGGRGNQGPVPEVPFWHQMTPEYERCEELSRRWCLAQVENPPHRGLSRDCHLLEKIR